MQWGGDFMVNLLSARQLLRSWTYRRLEEKNAVNGGENAGENGDAASRQKAENEKQGRKRWMIKRQ